MALGMTALPLPFALDLCAPLPTPLPAPRTHGGCTLPSQPGAKPKAVP